MTHARIAVLASGRGTNLAALLEASQRDELGGRVVLVISDNAGAAALEKARMSGVEALHLPGGPGRARLDGPSADAYVRTLTERRIDLLVLAGYMRIVGPPLLAAFPDRVVNIHPSLLPAFPGLRAQHQALAYGVKVAGCTAHLVDDTVDGGPILAQEAVPVHDDDTEESLSARILGAEHRVLPHAVRLLASGAVQRDGRRLHTLTHRRIT